MGSHMQRVSFRRNGIEVGCGQCEVRESPDHAGVYGFMSEIDPGIYSSGGLLPIKKVKGEFVVDLPDE
ncbi:Uncharacterised protein [Enterobacter ludwigii]|nr:Uncharacterised protein [Enterobacter ludwigii]